ncbi:MAG: cupin domain-containing protein [Alphaproteobacteria bacterium]|nr:cupin domain-containing protein [Alphaproteobacteria bacterium]
MKINIAKARARTGSRYPKPFDEPCRNKTRRRLGLAAGLTQFGVNPLELGPGAWSSQRYWHAHEDESVYVARGPVVLVTDAGETILNTGDCAGFKPST